MFKEVGNCVIPSDEGGESSILGPPCAGGLLLSQALSGLPVSPSLPAFPDPSPPLVMEAGVALLTFEFSSGAHGGEPDLPLDGGPS